MRTHLHQSLIATLGVACLCAVMPWYGTGIASAKVDGLDTNEQPASVAEQLRALENEIQEQTKRIDRLYRALGPHLEELQEQAAEYEKEEKEDQAFALQQIREVNDLGLTSVGCGRPTSAEFAVVTSEGGVRIFNAEGQVAKDLREPNEHITCIAFSPNGTELLSGTESGKLLIWNVEEEDCTTVPTHAGRTVDRVTWLGNERIVWGAHVRYGKEGGVPIDSEKSAGSVMARKDGTELWRFRGFVRDDFYTIAGALDGAHLAVLDIPGQPRGAFLLEGPTGEVQHICHDKLHRSGPLSVSFSPDGNTLAVGYAPFDIILWNTRTGERRKLLEGHSNWVVSLAFSADNKLLISGAGDSTARVWDTETGREIGRIRFPGESTYVEGVGLSPDGEVAFASMRGLLIAGRLNPGASSHEPSPASE